MLILKEPLRNHTMHLSHCHGLREIVILCVLVPQAAVQYIHVNLPLVLGWRPPECHAQELQAPHLPCLVTELFKISWALSVAELLTTAAVNWEEGIASEVFGSEVHTEVAYAIYMAGIDRLRQVQER